VAAGSADFVAPDPVVRLLREVHWHSVSGWGCPLPSANPRMH
jgi:hypothetical protein